MMRINSRDPRPGYSPSEIKEADMSYALRKSKTIVAALLLAGAAILTVTAPAGARVPLFDDSRGVLSVAPVLEQVTPAVINIAVLTRVRVEENPLLKDPFFRKFFGLPETGKAPQERRALSAGSGVIINAARGHVVTNYHVVKDAERIAVTLRDGRQLEGKVVGSDAATDLALIGVDPKGLKGVTIGDSDALKVGDVVLAIGNPFGLGQTVTSGIVSALGRSGLQAENYEDFIQTDAPINPGNSGGALINTKGELIGINSAIVAPAGGNVGIGFAVPTSIVKAVVSQLERHGKVRRGRIGVSVQSVTPDIALKASLAQVAGAYVSGIEKGSPAERAGLRAGDVIIAIDDRPVLSASGLRTRIGLTEAGQAVSVSYLRQGQRQTARIAITPAE
jgi:Do/DeqQ family serine protease